MELWGLLQIPWEAGDSLNERSLFTHTATTFNSGHSSLGCSSTPSLVISEVAEVEQELGLEWPSRVKPTTTRTAYWSAA